MSGKHKLLPYQVSCLVRVRVECIHAYTFQVCYYMYTHHIYYLHERVSPLFFSFLLYFCRLSYFNANNPPS
jgi:hypothetical protein